MKSILLPSSSAESSEVSKMKALFFNKRQKKKQRENIKSFYTKAFFSNFFHRQNFSLGHEQTQSPKAKHESFI